MRKFSANQKTLLARNDVQADYLVKTVINNTTTTYHTTAGYPITIPSIATFVATEGLSTIEAPRLSKVVDRETYKIVYIDTDFSKRALFEAGLTGAKIIVYLCFVNTTSATLGGAAPGEHLTDLADLLVVYAGTVDTQGYSVNPADGKIVAVIECSSPMAALGLTRSFYTSKESMHQVASADTSFDQVYVGSKQVNYLWGKAA